MRAVLKAQINKTDRNDARGMAQMMRAGLYRPVHVKTLRSQKLRMLLTHRKLLQSKAIAIDNDLRGTLRNFGLKVGVVGTVKFETRIKELVENLPDPAVLPIGLNSHAQPIPQFRLEPYDLKVALSFAYGPAVMRIRTPRSACHLFIRTYELVSISTPNVLVCDILVDKRWLNNRQFINNF
jgi:hypothetical protein